MNTQNKSVCQQTIDKLNGLLLQSELSCLKFECNAGILWISGPKPTLLTVIKLLWEMPEIEHIEIFSRMQTILRISIKRESDG